MITTNQNIYMIESQKPKKKKKGNKAYYKINSSEHKGKSRRKGQRTTKTTGKWGVKWQ